MTTFVQAYNTGVCLATHETPKKETTPKVKFSKLKDFDQRIVCIGVIYPVGSVKSGLIIELGLLLHCHFGHFRQKPEKNSKTLVGQIVGQIRPWIDIGII